MNNIDTDFDGKSNEESAYNKNLLKHYNHDVCDRKLPSNLDHLSEFDLNDYFYLKKTDNPSLYPNNKNQSSSSPVNNKPPKPINTNNTAKRLKPALKYTQDNQVDDPICNQVQKDSVLRYLVNMPNVSKLLSSNNSNINVNNNSIGNNNFSNSNAMTNQNNTLLNNFKLRSSNSCFPLDLQQQQHQHQQHQQSQMQIFYQQQELQQKLSNYVLLLLNSKSSVETNSPLVTSNLEENAQKIYQTNYREFLSQQS